MDPNETLKRLRAWYESWSSYDEIKAKEMFEALDEWLSKGGSLPADWSTRNTGPRSKI